MKFENKQSLILLGIAILLVLIVGIMIISSLFLSPSPTEQVAIPTPTPVPYTRNSDGIFTFTPLQRTVINKTTEKEVLKNQTILNKSIRGNTTVYEVPSQTPEETDEIYVRNGVVVSENINVFNDKAGFPPKISVYTKEFGEPEKVIDGVSHLGKFISAYIYAKDGFTLYANRYTQTVYEVHRFTPMSTAEYEQQFKDYLQPAPAYPQEAFQD